MNAKSLTGFLWFYFFISIVIISALSFHVSDVKNTLSDTKDKVDALEQRNQSLSYNLTKTRDSLEVATSQDILWLSRILYSETGKPLEMYYIAHVVKTGCRPVTTENVATKVLLLIHMNSLLSIGEEILGTI